MPIDAAQIDLILRKVDQLPQLPAAAVRVLEATREDAPDLSALTEAVAVDPSVAARVLGAANRASSGTRSVATVERAVVKLGVQAVRSLVLSLGVVDAMSGAAADVPATGVEGFTLDGFWRHSLAVATAAELLAEHAKPAGGKIQPGEAFCAGLLHDLGKLALRIAFPKAHARVCEAAGVLRSDLCRLEREIIGVDHQAAGRRLAERWNLPTHLSDVVFLHNTPPDDLATLDVASPALVHLVSLADQVVRRQHLGYSGNHAFGTPRDRLLRETGIAEPQVASVETGLVEYVRERVGWLGLESTTNNELYRQAVAEADRELRASESHLVDARRKLAEERRQRRAEAAAHEQRQREAQNSTQGFAHLATLAAAVGPAATVRSALGRIAASACELLSARADTPASPAVAVAFARCEGGIATVAWADGGEVDFSVIPDATDLSDAVAGLHLPGERTRLDCGDAGEVVVPGTNVRISGDVIEGWTLALKMVLERERQQAANDRLAEKSRAMAGLRQQAVRDRSLLAVAEMAAGAAHEMNNPLMVISGRGQLLYREATDPRHKRAALAIHQNAGRLGEMVEQLMRFARPEVIRHNGVSPKGDVGEIVESAIELVAASFGGAMPRGLTLTIDLPRDLPAVAVDARQWTRAVAAVLENAVQATPPDGGTVIVRAARLDDLVHLRVEDDGIGMDEAGLKRAFDPFYSGLAAGRRRGMGLTVAQRLVELDGGTLSLESQPGQGTRAAFTLPLAVPAQSPRGLGRAA